MHNKATRGKWVLLNGRWVITLLPLRSWTEGSYKLGHRPELGSPNLAESHQFVFLVTRWEGQCRSPLTASVTGLFCLAGRWLLAPEVTSVIKLPTRVFKAISLCSKTLATVIGLKLGVKRCDFQAWMCHWPKGAKQNRKIMGPVAQQFCPQWWNWKEVLSHIFNQPRNQFPLLQNGKS